MSLAILFHFLCAQHVSDINMSIIGSLLLFCWITALVVLFLVWCVLEFRCGWVGVVSVLQAEAQLQHVSDINVSIIRSLRLFCWITTLVVLFLVQCVLEFRCGWVGVVSVLQAEAQLQHVSDINISIIRSLWLFCWITTLVVLFLIRCVLEFRCGWVGVVSVLQAEAQLYFSLQHQPHRNSNTQQTKNNTTNVVIQQNSRKFPMMDILMSETCRAHKKWNKITSDIKLVFYSSTITMMHGPVNIRFGVKHRESYFNNTERCRSSIRMYFYVSNVRLYYEGICHVLFNLLVS